MNNKKVQAQMKINVSFLADVTQLTKQLETATKKLDLSAGFSKNIADGLSKGFKEIYSNIDKMTEGLSRKGLSAKQYTTFFNDINTKLQDSLKLTQNLRKSMQDAFNSQENKEGLKTLELYKKQLEEINKLASTQKGAQSRQATSIQKLKDEFGIDYNISKKTLSEIYGRVSDKKGLTNKQQAWAGNYGIDEAGLKRVVKLYEQIIAHQKTIREANASANTSTEKGGVDASIEYLEKQIARLETSVITKDALKQNNVVLNTVEAIGNELEHQGEQVLPKYNVELDKSTIEAEKLAKASSTLKDIFAQFGITFSVATVVRGFKELIKYSFDFYKSLDSALNEIYVVSNLTSTAVNNLKSNFINMAKETGMSIDDVTRAAVLFYQQGLNTNEVMIMTEVTSQFAKVAGIDATDAADKLTAAVNGYCLAAENASEVADKFNKVAAASAADINELSTAFSKAAAQANQAGVSMDNYLAYIATMEEATREAPENIGTSLKTIFSRMQQIKTGENTEDSTDVNQVETALKSVGIALRDTQGQLRDLEEIFDELGPKWNSLNRNTQAYLGTIIAGTRQQSRFITLMQNWDRVQDLADQSANSAGQQALMHAKAMDSITSKMQQFKVAWQELVSNLSSSNIFKGIITLGTNFIKLFSDGNKPVMIFSLAIAALGKKLKELQPIISGKFASLKKGIFGGTFTSETEKNQALDNIVAQQVDVQSKIEAKTEQLNQLTVQQEGIKNANKRKEIDDQRKAIEKDIVDLKKQENKLEKEGKEVADAKVVSKREQVGNGLKAAGIAMTGAGIAISGADKNLGSVIGSIGPALTAVGQFATGDIIGGIASTATAAYQIFQTVDKWDENIKARVEESVNAVNDALTKVNNYNTGIKSTDALLERYDKLQKKLYRTNAEQEELNNIIQELGDTYNVDTVTDAYGNMLINIRDVNLALDEQKSKRDEALKDLRKEEINSLAKATSGLGNNTTIEEYYSKLFASNRSQYRTLLSGLEDGLTDEARAVSSSVAQTFANNLKTSIIANIEYSADEHIFEGISQAVVDMENSINETLGKDKDSWTELYSRIDFLEKNINDMTYEEAQNYLQEYFDKWHEEIGLTQEQWDVLVDSINNTVFGNSSLIKFFDQVKEYQDKSDDEYWTNAEGTGKIDRLREQVVKAYNDYNSKVSGFNKTSHFVGSSISGNANGYNNPDDFIKELDKGRNTGFGLGINDIFRNKEGDKAADTLDSVSKAYKEARKEREKYLQTFSEEHNLLGEEDAEMYIDSLGEISSALQHTNKDTLDYLGSIKELYDAEGLTGKEIYQMSQTVRDVIGSMNSYGNEFTNADRYEVLSQYYEKNKDQLSDKIRDKWEKILDKAFSQLEITTPKTLTQIGEELKDIGTDLVNMNKIIDEFNESSSLSLDTFIDLAKIIDGIDLSELGKMDKSAIDGYIQAIENLNLAYDANNGRITMNADSLATLQKIQELQTKTKIASMISELKATKATQEVEIAYVKAQIAATQVAIDAASDQTKATIEGDKIKARANGEFNDVFQESVNNILTGYENDVKGQGEWATAILSNIGTVGEAWGKYFLGLAHRSSTTLLSLKKEAEKVSFGNAEAWEGSNAYSGIDWDKYEVINRGSKEQEELVSQLTNYKKSLENTLVERQNALRLTENEISWLEKIYNSDLSALGSSSSEKGQELQDYIGKLKEIYNILNRIQNLEHRLSTLDTYSDIVTGERYGKMLQERLGYNEELLDQYDFLVREQKAFTNGYKDLIESSAVADVFDFDKFGQIIINFDKYNALQSQAVSGEKSLKEQADELYETYTDMYKELQGYFDKYITYLKQVLALEQEMIDAYVTMEDKAANAVKEIYKKILDTKLDAIDQEKEAIEDLRKAREDARNEQKNAKEVTGLQTNLQRAMMDTSGASDIAFIKAQNDITDKMEEIADDKYGKMLDNIVDRLDEEKNALQEEFDELWENMDWLFGWLDESIMLDDDRLRELLQQTDEWNTSSELQRAQLMQDWDTNYQTYMQGLTGGSTIYDVWDMMQQNKNRIDEMDKALQSEISHAGIQVANAVAQGLSGAYSSGYNAGSSRGNSYYGGGGNLTDFPDDNKTNIDGTRTNLEVKQYSDRIESMATGSYTKWIGQKVELKGSGTVTAYNDDGTIAKNLNNPGWYNPDVRIIAVGKNSTAYFAKVESASNINPWDSKGYWIPIDSLQKTGLLWGGGKLGAFAKGGFAYHTGPAWLDGTPNQPEAVLDALQTEHFIKFTNALDHLFGNGNPIGNASSVSIDNISFNVASMSSPEDGEAAFNMFVSKFKEIGAQTGIKMNSFKNTL